MNNMATTEQFSLRWNNFHSNITTCFHQLLEAADLVDVTLAVEGHFLQAHKIVLSICSPYFKQMFKVNPCKHPIVILKDVTHENMKDILQFMYMGEVSVLRDNLTSFLRTAELLQVKGLTGDDSSDESQATKDEKPDLDNDDEPEEILNHLIQSNDELPRYSANLCPSISQPIKRQSKSTSPNSNSGKKSKTEPLTYPNRPIKPEICERQPVKINVDDTNCELHSEIHIETKPNCTEEPEEPQDMSLTGGATNMMLWDNNLNTTTSGTTVDSSVDPDGAVYTTDHKGHVYCSYCCRKFVNRYNLKVHMRDKHEANVRDLDCHVCGKTMRNPSCLRVHMYHHRKQQNDAPGVI